MIVFTVVSRLTTMLGIVVGSEQGVGTGWLWLQMHCWLSCCFTTACFMKFSGNLPGFSFLELAMHLNENKYKQPAVFHDLTHNSCLFIIAMSQISQRQKCGIQNIVLHILQITADLNKQQTCNNFAIDRRRNKFVLTSAVRYGIILNITAK